MPHLGPNIAVQWITFLLLIRVPGSNLGTQKDYPEGFRDFSQSLYTLNIRMHKIRPDRFLTHPHQLIIHQLLYIRNY
jgi:hypothetical protein